jgi:hypothetical protein
MVAMPPPTVFYPALLPNRPADALIRNVSTWQIDVAGGEEEQSRDILYNQNETFRQIDRTGKAPKWRMGG